MRYKSIELVNYIGIANGLGLRTIYIDFTKCKHRIIMIRGDNGSGKSTLFKALQASPDSSDMFIPGCDAKKTLELIDDETGTEYKIQFEHTYKEKGGYTTKGYIFKTFGDTTTNLNQQGTITACKDIIYNELSLDANFMALSQLSSDDKGLASKTPAQRKQFVSNIIESNEVYEAIHKTISKRSSIFKSMINSTTSKISKLGDENLLSSSLASLINRINNTNILKNEQLEQLGSQKRIILQLDPTGSIRDSYTTLENMLSDISNERSILDHKISSTLRELGITEASQSIYNDIHDMKINTQFQISQIESDIAVLLSRREEESSQLQSKISRFKALQSETNYITTKEMVESCTIKLNEYESFFKTMGLRDFSLTHDEYVIGLNTLKDIKETVDAFRDTVTFDIMNIALSEYISTNSYPDKKVIEDAIQGMEEYVRNCKDQLMYFINQQKVAEKLILRHTKCKLDDCMFIKDAVLAASENPIDNISRLEQEISDTEIIISQHNYELDRLNTIISAINYFKIIIRNIDSYASILKKLPNGNIFSNKDLFISKLLSGSTFDEINDIYPYITQASIIEDYNKTVGMMNTLKADIQIYESKNDLIGEIQSSIKDLDAKVNDISNQILNSQNTLFTLKQELDKYTYRELTIKTLLELYDDRKRSDIALIETQNNLKVIESSMATIQSAAIQINSINQRLSQFNNELVILERDKSEIEHAIRLLSEYKEEISNYMAKSEKIETIKFYSSYNTGIQTVFMELYMHQVNKIANRLMELVMNGKFKFKKWIIDENEFRIPVLPEGGYLNDDIKSLSGGELAIVSMVIGFSLLYQASTKYNILKLDEVDATLDATNRRQFTIVLDMLMEILKCQQLFMISHNDEHVMDNADIILFRTDDVNKYHEVLSSGNIIFNWLEVV